MEPIATVFPLVLSLMVASAGVMFLASVQVAVVSLFTRESRLYRSFAVMAVAVGLYQLSQAYSIQSLSLEQAVVGLKWQTGAAMLFYPSAFLFFATYTYQKKQVKPWFLVILLVSCVFFIINLISPSSIRFDQIIGFTSHTLPYGEVIHRLHGEPGALGYSVHLFSQVFLSGCFTVVIAFINSSVRCLPCYY